MLETDKSLVFRSLTASTAMESWRCWGRRFC